MDGAKETQSRSIHLMRCLGASLLGQIVLEPNRRFVGYSFILSHTLPIVAAQ